LFPAIPTGPAASGRREAIGRPYGSARAQDYGDSAFNSRPVRCGRADSARRADCRGLSVVRNCAIFRNNFKLICPVQSRSQKYSASPLPQISSRNPAIPFRKRGVGHRHERWDGMRWTRQRRARLRSQGGFRERSCSAQDERCSHVRQSRVVLAPVAGVKLAEVFRTQPGFR
jgi:hypothetical protein